MTIRNIMIALGFEVDDKSVSNAEKTIDGIKSMAAKALGALGVALSLQGLNEIAEEYGAINNQIRSATEGMGEQAEIQQQILKAAQNSRTAYGDTAKFVGNLVQSNKDLFGSVDEVAQYAELSNKLFQSAGKSSEQVAQMHETGRTGGDTGDLCAFRQVAWWVHRFDVCRCGGNIWKKQLCKTLVIHLYNLSFYENAAFGQAKTAWIYIDKIGDL